MHPDQLETAAEQSAQFVRDQFPHQIRFGIILGTGSGQLGEEIEADLKLGYEEIPNFPRSTAMGHKGQLICGRLAGEPIIAMQGRFHLYEGYPVDVATLPIRVMKRLGVEVLFISNASGGINPKIGSGEIMLIESHIDLMCRLTPNVFHSPSNGRPSRRIQYDEALIVGAEATARANNFQVHRGVYAAMLGPNYETRAEYRFLKRIGADAVGMSTVPEVNVASVCEMRILGLSVITNVAKPDVLAATSGQEVIDAAKVAGPNLKAIVMDAIQNASPSG